MFITPNNQNPITSNLLFTQYDSKDEKHRISKFVMWLNKNHTSWLIPDLETYREYLLRDYAGRANQTLSHNSVRAHLATIRSRYRKLLKSNQFRNSIYQAIDPTLSPSDQKAMVDELFARLSNAIDPINSSVQLTTSQDVEDSKHIRLSPQQAQELLAFPDDYTLIGKRDKAVIALLLCTGVREAELCALKVVDLRKRLAGELSLHVRKGKGAKERLIPYGDLEWGLHHVDEWMRAANITENAVFRGIYKGGKSIRPTPLTKRAINQILDKYPINHDSSLIVVKPHDLRRTYARSLYESGMDLLAIRDNLGHGDTRTTLQYIGTMDVVARKPTNIYNMSINPTDE